MEGKEKVDRTYIHGPLSATFATTDAFSHLLIETGIIMQQEFLQKVSDERATYQRMLKPIPQ